MMMDVSYGTFPGPGKSVDEYSNSTMLDGRWISKTDVKIWRRRLSSLVAVG